MMDNFRPGIDAEVKSGSFQPEKEIHVLEIRSKRFVQAAEPVKYLRLDQQTGHSQAIQLAIGTIGGIKIQLGFAHRPDPVTEIFR